MAAAWLFLALPAHGVTFEWSVVGAPGNPCDTQIWNCPGTVARPYRIAKHEVTNAQYAEFLNAKAASDPLSLYNTDMGAPVAGGIQRAGNAGSYTYSPIAGGEAMPVSFVSFYDVVRFANWMHTGQGSGDTETGAYTLLGGTPIPTNEPLVRNAGALVFIPDNDEWYKAAYYDTGSGTYFDYPTGTDTPTLCSTPGPLPHTANCGGVVGSFTSAGSYSGAASPNGTFDQGGNAVEWIDRIEVLDNRAIRGGHLGSSPIWLSGTRSEYDDPWFESSAYGFRVAATVPPLAEVTNVRAFDSAATWFEWDAVMGATSAVYDLVRGQVSSLSTDASGIELGPLICIEEDSLDRSSLSHPDAEIPSPGAAFFYVVRLQEGPVAGPWGSGSEGRPRHGGGGCAP